MLKKTILVATFFVLIGTACLAFQAPGEATVAVHHLPSSLGDVRENTHGIGTRAWTIPDIIEVRRITSIAIDETSRQVAFIVAQSFVDSDQIRYGLYVIDRSRPHLARKLVEASYLSDLSWHPKTDRWTLRGDFGLGVQLYDIGNNGNRYPLVINPRTALVGGYEGVTTDPFGPQQTGVLAYGWSPNGSALWYSRLRLYAKPRQQELSNRGYVYDDRSMGGWEIINGAITKLLGTELHIVRGVPPVDRQVAFIAANALSDRDDFRSVSTAWSPDGSFVQYGVPVVTNGVTHFVPWEVDAVTGRTRLLPSKAKVAYEGFNSQAWHTTKTTDTLHECVFTRDMSSGACVRESLTTAPELVAVLPGKGTITTLVRPNARYDEIAPLHTVAKQWKNAYGNTNTGYITYPRNYVAGQRYPVIVVTHARDAKNLFAYDGFQWEFPIQVFAERGYVVLSVNEAHMQSDYTASTMILNTVASMEAALQSAIADGLADPAKTGIAGYSRGGEVTQYVMSQSKMFHAASDGDDPGWNTGGYWLAGNRAVDAIYTLAYGGSPFDPRALPNYQRFAPSFRAPDFAGPLLMQFTASGPDGLELYTALQDADIPVEYVLFPGESHIFWKPDSRAAAMERNLQWFDYWLLGKRDPHPIDQGQYNRWDAMKQAWKHN